MDVRVRVPAQLRDLVGWPALVALDVPTGANGSVTVADALDLLGSSHPALERRLRDERGSTRVHVNLFVGADNVRDREGERTVIAEGEELTIMPAVSGG